MRVQAETALNGENTFVARMAGTAEQTTRQSDYRTIQAGAERVPLLSRADTGASATSSSSPPCSSCWWRGGEPPGHRGHAPDLPVASNIVVFALFNLNLIVFLLLILLFRNLVKLWFERRQKVLGSRFKTKLVLAFLSLALAPGRS